MLQVETANVARALFIGDGQRDLTQLKQTKAEVDAKRAAVEQKERLQAETAQIALGKVGGWQGQVSEKMTYEAQKEFADQMRAADEKQTRYARKQLKAVEESANPKERAPIRRKYQFSRTQAGAAR